MLKFPRSTGCISSSNLLVHASGCLKLDKKRCIRPNDRDAPPEPLNSVSACGLADCTISSILIGASLYDKIHGLYLQLIYMSAICDDKLWELIQRSPIRSYEFVHLDRGSAVWRTAWIISPTHYISAICDDKLWEVTERSPIRPWDLTILIGSPIWDKIHGLYLELTYVSAICDYADAMFTNSCCPYRLSFTLVLLVLTLEATVH